MYCRQNESNSKFDFQCIIALSKIHDATYYVVLNFEGWSKH